MAPYNIRVNAVAPGFIETDMTKELDQGHRKKFLDMIPLGKFGTPEEVAQTVIFLASDKSHYITGQTIQIDGGLGM